MLKSKYKVIGVMSGTSLDGIDLACISFDLNEGIWSFNIGFFETVPYNSEWEHTLTNLIFLSNEELRSIDEKYTALLAKIINEFIEEHKIGAIDAICSHGHTALHVPEQQFTYQIGNLPAIASMINHTVVCNFRVQDVELGGQGAPLVPIGDAMLFSNYDYCLNLGGFANISTDINGDRIAYDICPVNIVLNHFTKTINLDYDHKGEIASSGQVNLDLLRKLNALEFYSQPYPKSLGLEWVNETVLPLIDVFEITIEDVLRTFVEHIAFQISEEIQSKKTVLITGGGVYNEFLINRIRALSDSEIIVPETSIIEYKEALIFGLLGVLKLRDEVNCLSSVTGAKHNHSTGVIFYP